MDSFEVIPLEDADPEDLEGPSVVVEVPADVSPAAIVEAARGLVRILEGLDSVEAFEQFTASIQRVDSHERQLLERFVSDMLPGRIPAPPTKRASLPDAFPRGVGKAFNNPAVRTSLNAISRGGPKALSLENGWKKTGNTFTFQMNQQGGGTITCFIQGPRQDDGQEAEKYSAEQQLDVIHGFGGLTLDVVLGIMATLTAPTQNYKEARYPRPGRVLIDTNSLMKYKGFNRRGQDRVLLEKQIQTEMERVRSVWMHIDAYRVPPQKTDNTKKARGYDTVREKTPLFEMTEIELGNRTLFNELDVMHTVWEIGVGSWGRSWWNEDNGTSHWVQDASKALIELPHTETGAILAKKIALGAFICAGKNPELMLEPMKTTVGEVLRNYIGLPEEQKRGNDWARRERERLEAAFEILENVEILERVEWPDGYGPADVYRGKGWSRGWLAARVVLHPAQPKQEQMTVGGQLQPLLPATVQKPRASRKPRRNKARYAVDGQMARQVRERLAARRDQGLPIYDVASLAKHLKLSQSHIYNVLGGRFHLGREPYQALLAFLKQPQ